MLFIRVLLFTIFVPGFVTVGVPYWLLTSGINRLAYDIGPARILGCLPIVMGVAGYGWCAWEFAASGRGTPAPIDPPKELVVRGLYRLVRNPIYVSVLLVLLGEGIVFQSVTLLIYAWMMWTLFHLFVVIYEEPNLKRRFGSAFEAYSQTVPRWIPRVNSP
jgi:protein-S-isoprenylcysteine O-methyltransferase Ste14